MKPLLQGISNANKLTAINVLAFGLIVVIHILLISVFVKYFQIKSGLNNPLIPRSIIDYSFQPYALKGLILSFGLPVILLLKHMKQNILVVIGGITILVTYAFTDHIMLW